MSYNYVKVFFMITYVQQNFLSALGSFNNRKYNTLVDEVVTHDAYVMVLIGVHMDIIQSKKSMCTILDKADGISHRLINKLVSIRFVKGFPRS